MVKLSIMGFQRTRRSAVLCSRYRCKDSIGADDYLGPVPQGYFLARNYIQAVDLNGTALAQIGEISVVRVQPHHGMDAGDLGIRVGQHELVLS